MAWTTPPTFSNGAVLTAAQLNILVDDLNETGPGKAVTEPGYFVNTAANTITERTIPRGIDNTAGTTTSSSFTDLTGTDTGPAVTADTDTTALVVLTATFQIGTTARLGRAGYAISGATTVAAANARAVSYQATFADANDRRTATNLYESLTAGSNTFTMKYNVTGSATLTASKRRIFAMGF